MVMFPEFSFRVMDIVHSIEDYFSRTYLYEFQIIKLQAAIKYGEEDLPAAQVSVLLYVQPEYLLFCTLVQFLIDMTNLRI